MKTVTKLALARQLYRVITIARSMGGQSDKARVTRNGGIYELDLTEGIDLAIFLGLYERETTRVLRRLVKPGFSVLDIGANIGAHTLSLAAVVGDAGRVLAFEPTHYAYDKLVKNVALNPDIRNRITAIKCFLGREGAQTPEVIPSRWPLAVRPDTHPVHGGLPVSAAAVPSRSLDAVLDEHGWEHVDLIKLDVDGWECDVLSGASNTIERHEPIFVMELAPYCLHERGGSVDHLLSLLPDYSLSDVEGRSLPRTSKKLADIIGNGASINVVAMRSGDASSARKIRKLVS